MNLWRWGRRWARRDDELEEEIETHLRTAERGLAERGEKNDEAYGAQTFASFAHRYKTMSRSGASLETWRSLRK